MDTSSASLNAGEIAIGLLGGLALFLYGMQKMSEGLKAAAGEGMKKLLGKLTRNRFSAAATGALVTAVIQSSSVTTVLVVGFISAGLMSLGQSVGVIMGANVGTTITAQIVAFKVTQYAWAMVAAGFGLFAFSKKDVFRQYGAMLIGLGLLFLGMDQMSAATAPLRTFEPFIEFMRRMDHPLWGIVLGAGFTALVQSSSATTGIVIMLASQGFLSLEAGIALAIGANIGTCFTAVLSALGKPVEAVRAAAVHVLFNLLGALLWLAFIPDLAEWARAFSPAYEALAGVERLAAETPRQIANANSIFNVANTLILIWFTGPIARLAMKLVPDRPVERPDQLRPKFLDEVYLETPSLGLDRIRLELGHMGDRVVRMLEGLPAAERSGQPAELRRLAAMDDDVDRLHRAILTYSRRLARHELKASETGQLQRYLTIAHYLESTGDLVETNLVRQELHLVERVARRIPQLESTETKLWDSVVGSLADVLRALEQDDRDMAAEVVRRKPEIHALARQAQRTLTELVGAERVDLETFRVGADIVSQVKRMYYNVRKIAQIVAAGPEAPEEPNGESP